MTIIIRRATAAEADVIEAVMQQSFEAYRSAYTPEAYQATALNAEQIRSRLNEGPIWVAAQGALRVIVGTLAARPRGQALYVRSMAIVPAARGQQLGRRLLETVQDFALQNSFTSLFLSTTPFLSRAIRLYEGFGFQRSDEGPHELFGTPLVTMVKMLE